MNFPIPSALPLSRRDFVARAGLGLAAACIIPSNSRAASGGAVAPVGASASTAARSFEIAAFEKHFYEKYSPEELAQTCEEMDLHVELTVRPEGHIKPVQWWITF